MPVRILYIDDDPVLVRLAEKVLARHDFAVTHAATPSIGHDLLEGGGFEAVVLDHYFQGTTGLQFLGTLGEKVDQIPIIYVTGSSDAQIAIAALKGGARDYVIKSADDDFFPLLVTALDQALENAQLRRAKADADRLLVVAKERAELLFAEMNHRIANSLSLVAAMIRMQMQAVGGEEARVALEETQSRIAAIAGVHRSLYTSAHVGDVDLKIYINAIVLDLEGSAGGSRELVRIIADIEPMWVTPDKAVALGVIVTELITNAMKYAYPEGPGEIRVALRNGGDRASLCVEDDGIGYNPGARPKGSGLGTRLLQAMATNLGANIVAESLDTRERGTRVTVTWAP